MPALLADLPASLFIVVHIGENVSHLHELLGRAASMPISSAKNGVSFERARLISRWSLRPSARSLLTGQGAPCALLGLDIFHVVGEPIVSVRHFLERISCDLVGQHVRGSAQLVGLEAPT